MERWQHALTKNDELFKQLFGVKKEVFLKMKDVVTENRESRRKKGGRRPKLTPGDQVLLALQYWREYRTMPHLAYEYQIATSSVCDTIQLVENVLIQNEMFHVAGKKALLEARDEGRTLAVDVTESPVERPKKNKRNGTQERKKDIQSRLKSLSTSIH